MVLVSLDLISIEILHITKFTKRFSFRVLFFLHLTPACMVLFVLISHAMILELGFVEGNLNTPKLEGCFGSSILFGEFEFPGKVSVVVCLACRFYGCNDIEPCICLSQYLLQEGDERDVS